LAYITTGQIVKKRLQINVDPRLGMPLGSNATKFSNYDTYENEEELLKEREEKT